MLRSHLLLPSCVPYFKLWNEKLLMRKAGNQEFFGQPRLYWSDKQTERTKELARMATTIILISFYRR